MIGLKKLLKLFPNEKQEAKDASDLHYAAYLGNMNMLLEKLSADVTKEDINKLDDNGHTPLFVAVEKGYTDVVEILLKHGSDPNLTSDTYDNASPLHSATTSEIAELLISHGADINAPSKNGETPIHTATRRHASDVVNVLVTHGSSINGRNEFGMTPLHLMCEHIAHERENDIKIARRLMSAGVEVNARNLRGKTALHYLAASCDTYRLVSLLLSYGADIDIQDMKGYFPIHYFMMHYRSYSEKDPKLTLKLLLPSEKAANLTDYQGKSALHCLSENMDEDLIQFTIAKGGNVNLEDNTGKSPLHYLSDMSSKAKDVVTVLVSNGAHINARDAWGRTPLMIAADKKSTSLVENLIQSGADVNISDKRGNTALHIACYRNELQIVEILLSSGANIQATDIYKTSPLHAASFAGSLNCVKCLLEGSVDRNSRDAESRTPFDIAVNHRYNDVIYALSSDLEKLESKTVELTNVCNEMMQLQSVLTAMENNAITRNGRRVETFISELLQSPTIGRGSDEYEAQEIQRVIENVIQTLAKRLTNYDSNFQCTVLHAGSTSEGTKTKKPNEFDFMVCLEVLSELVEVEFPDDNLKVRTHVTVIAEGASDDVDDSSVSEPMRETVSVSDYVFLKVKDKASARPFEPYLIITGSVHIPRIPCCAMYEGFSDLISKVLFSKDFPTDPRLIPVAVTLEPTIEFHWHGSRYKDMEISVDLVPALRMPQWPENSRRDCKLLTEAMLNLDCLAVPKMTSGEDEDLWRCSLALVETSIFRLMQAEIRNSYIVCKCLLSSDILPVINFENDEEFELFKAYKPELFADDSVTIHEFVEGILPSYVIKMTFLSVLEERIEQFGIGHVYTVNCSDNEKQPKYLPDSTVVCTETCDNGEKENSDTTSNGNSITGISNAVRYGPATTMHVAERSLEYDLTLVRDVFRVCEKRLEERFVPSVFNKEHNILGNRLLSGDVDKALIFIRIVNQLLS